MSESEQGAVRETPPHFCHSPQTHTGSTFRVGRVSDSWSPSLPCTIPGVCCRALADRGCTVSIKGRVLPATEKPTGRSSPCRIIDVSRSSWGQFCCTTGFGLPPFQDATWAWASAPSRGHCQPWVQQPGRESDRGSPDHHRTAQLKRFALNSPLPAAQDDIGNQGGLELPLAPIASRQRGISLYWPQRAMA